MSSIQPEDLSVQPLLDRLQSQGSSIEEAGGVSIGEDESLAGGMEARHHSFVIKEQPTEDMTRSQASFDTLVIAKGASITGVGSLQPSMEVTQSQKFRKESIEAQKTDGWSGKILSGEEADSEKNTVGKRQPS